MTGVDTTETYPMCAFTRSQRPPAGRVSRLKLRNVVPEKIADVGVHKDYAYLAAWGVVTCTYSGVHVVDISDVGSPEGVVFKDGTEYVAASDRDHGLWICEHTG